MKKKPKFSDWTGKERVSPGWRRIGYLEPIMPGDCWRRIVDTKEPGCYLPEGDYWDIAGYDRYDAEVAFTEGDLAGHRVEENWNVGVWEIFRRIDGYVPKPRKLPLNPIFSKKVNLP